MEVTIAPKARSDIASILAWTEENLGPRTSKRYGKLIATAIEQVAVNPALAGGTKRAEIVGDYRTYHLFFSRKAAGRAGDRIRHPRHFLVYRVSDANVVEIARVLHDSMELPAHLPEENRGSPE
ncbi:MAG TPA: type II toxin-antitoxin system RelE/ParE family toxin [Pirellulales bacterium]|nr:type II toxin-antitoxin system RelE/ParE family toxin [Pirellulales bacterium]